MDRSSRDRSLQKHSLGEERKEFLSSFLSSQGVRMTRLHLLDLAFTHPSFSSVTFPAYDRALYNNQRLEYLGDSILNLIIDNYLYHRFPSYSEGQITQISSTLVSDQSLAKIARRLEFGKFLQLGYGEEKSGGRKRESNLADSFEAVIAAIYLDQGYTIIESCVLKWFNPELNHISHPEQSKGAKTRLQEFTQKHFQLLPVYEELSRTGPDHHKKYKIRVLIQEKEYAVGEGMTLKGAAEQAASFALEKIQETKQEKKGTSNQR